TEGLEMMRALPGLGLLLVTFSASIRTDDLGRIGRNSALRGKAEDHQHAAEKKHGGPEPDPIRRHRPFPPGAGGDRERVGPSAGWWAKRATPSRGSERFPRPCRRWWAGTDPRSRPRRCAPR